MSNVSRPIRTLSFSSNDFRRKPLKVFGQRNDMTHLHLKIITLDVFWEYYARKKEQGDLLEVSEKNPK